MPETLQAPESRSGMEAEGIRDVRVEGQRVRYTTERGDGQGGRVDVICDVYPDGSREFSEQEPGEVRWFRFEPSQKERAAIDKLLAEKRK